MSDIGGWQHYTRVGTSCNWCEQNPQWSSEVHVPRSGLLSISSSHILILKDRLLYILRYVLLLVSHLTSNLTHNSSSSSSPNGSIYIGI